MRKSKYSEHQIFGAPKRAEAGVPVKDLCRELAISSVPSSDDGFGGREP